MNAQIPERVDSDSLTWRAATEADLPKVHALSLAAAADDPHSQLHSLPDLRREFDDPWSPPATDSWLAQRPDGSLAAYGRVTANPEPDEAARAFLDADVHPDFAGGAVEETLLDWLEHRAKAGLRAITDAHPLTQPAVLRTAIWDQRPERIRRYKARGFRPIRHYYRMRRDLGQPIPHRPLPGGLAWRNYEPELDEALRLALNESFSENWGYDFVPESDWQMFHIQDSSFRPDLTWVVMDGDEVAAFSLNRFDPAEPERIGYRAGWIDRLGTRQPWRKRGLASALLVKSMQSFQEAGLDYAVLGVDSENATGALGLYEGLGFGCIKRTILFEKQAEPVGG